MKICRELQHLSDMESLWMEKDPVSEDLNLWLPLVEVSGDRKKGLSFTREGA